MIIYATMQVVTLGPLKDLIIQLNGTKKNLDQLITNVFQKKHTTKKEHINLTILLKYHIKSLTTKNNSMKTALLTSILALVISGLTISGLLRYNGILRYNLAEIAIQNTDGADIDITETLHAYGFDLDVFDEPTTFDYIKSNFK